MAAPSRPNNVYEEVFVAEPSPEVPTEPTPARRRRGAQITRVGSRPLTSGLRLIALLALTCLLFALITAGVTVGAVTIVTR
jgi:hypothetical protein